MNAHKMMTEEKAQLYILIEATLTMLQNRSVKLMMTQIASELKEKEIELKLPKKERTSYEWLKKFHQGKIDDPDHPKVIKKIERLNKYLVSKLNPTLT